MGIIFTFYQRKQGGDIYTDMWVYTELLNQDGIYSNQII